ncbi:hypothetical protein M413DRAFT_248700 [Hebeloma cylindrosporum]|uniref:C2H2-type domain-containing protein n=1 Tax=Hebeloma cylindrosporum TaxID=76867 RepID=A0A0C3C3U4_HEBCY|nr:hypothetical protein M413DRAFT_248700 [Hebeloma cylindrosporum h7]
MPIAPFCLTCGKTFATVSGMRSHCRSKRRHKAYSYVCEPCDLAFVHLAALQSHINSPRHAYDDLSDYTFNSDVRHKCNLCAKEFKTRKALSQHKDSLAHRDRTLQCLFCHGMFKSASGIAFHLESGCHQVSRHEVTAAVHAMQVSPPISLNPLMIEAAAAPTVPHTVDDDAAHSFVYAVPSSFNGRAYQCHLCYKAFRSLYSLTGHLNSPAHDDDEFMCPKCERRFKLVSGFIQHLESGACGLAKRKAIEAYFNDLSGQFSRLLKV